MADISLLNTTAQLSGKTVITEEGDYTITGDHTYDNDPGAPFIVTSGSAAVSNLDADKLDGYEAAALAVLAENETITGAWTFNGDIVLGGTTPQLTIGDGGSEDTALVFDGNAQDYYIALDDTADDLVIGLGSAVGTTPCLSFDETRASDFAAAIRESGVISPSQLTANTDNWNPTSLDAARIIRVSTDASRNLTGIAAQPAGTRLLIHNVGDFDLVLKHEVTSTAANRIRCPGGVDLTLATEDAAELWYDNSSGRWRVAGY